MTAQDRASPSGAGLSQQAAEPVPVSALRASIPDALVCDVCRQREALGVASSALGPCSWAYCRECLDKPAEVAVMIDATIDGCNGSANVADWAKQFWTWEDGAYISWADYAARHEGRILAEAAERDAELQTLSEADIDLTDIPEFQDFSEAVVGKYYDASGIETGTAATTGAVAEGDESPVPTGETPK